MYQFSSSSMGLFQQCIEVAKQNNDINPWKERFLQNSAFNHDEIVNTNTERTTTTYEIATMVCSQEDLYIDVNIVDPKNKIDETYRDIEADPISNINLIKEESSDGKLLISLAQNLNDALVEKLSNFVLENTLESIFIENFFKYFLPFYFKRDNTRLCLDLVLKAYKYHPVEFGILLKNILNIEINSVILQEFVSMLKDSEQMDILKTFVECDLPIDVFIKHILTITQCYKNSMKDENIDDFILVILKEASDKCTTDKQYGRLLLTFIQNITDVSNISLLKDIVEKHRSPFRRPCLNLLHEINKNKKIKQ